MIKKLALIIGSLCSLAGCQFHEVRYTRLLFPSAAPQTRVLMIGNSLTYSNDLPGLLQQFSITEPAPIYIEQVTAPFVSLRFHWNLDSAREKIRAGHFDYIILQDFSRKPVTNPNDSIKYFLLFNAEAKAAGAKVILFENWPRQRHEKEFPLLQSTYTTIQQQTGAALAPIGQAWQNSRAAHPDLPLLRDDRHPTDAGTYLAACVLYDVLYQKPSAALPLNLQAPNLPEETLQYLRTTADQTLAQK